MYFISVGNGMTFAVGEYREVRYKYKGVCLLCNKKMKASDPILIQQNITGDSDISCAHLTCFMKQIQDHFPEFWKQCILELI